jgi:hypothetical protein
LAIGEESGGDLGMSTLLIAFLMTTLAVTEEEDGSDRAYTLVVRFRHLAPIFACPRPNVEISRTTSNDKFLVEFLNLTFARRDCGIGDTNVKFTPLVPGEKRSENPADHFAMTTLAVGEEDGGDRVRAPVPGAKRSENPADDLTVTTMAIGEEDGG